MAIETLTIPLGSEADDGVYEGSKIRGDDILDELDNDDSDIDDRQIVTVTDGGDLSGTYSFEKWGKGTPTVDGDGRGGSDEFHFDLSGFDDDFSIAVKSMDQDDCFIFTGFDSYSETDGVYTFFYTGTDGQPHQVTIDPVSTNGSFGTAKVVVCFAQGSLIGTPHGEVPIEDLVEGDFVSCGDGQARAIRWIGQRSLTQAELKSHPMLRPIVLSAGALGDGRPTEELRLSPQHRVILQDWRAELYFGSHEVLVSAKSLVNDATIRTDVTCDGVRYYHILLDGHHTVFANGLECETLMPFEMAQAALSGAAREEIALLFPDIVTDIAAFGPTYQTTLKPYEVATLL